MYAPYYIVICGLSGCTIFFYINLINGMTFWGKELLNVKCGLIFLQILPEIFLIGRRIKRDVKLMSAGLHVKYMSMLQDFNGT